MTCEHKANNPEGVEWSVEDSVDHFIKCIDRDEQLKVWLVISKQADIGRQCWMSDHKEEVYSMRKYIQKLREQLDGKD